MEPKFKIGDMVTRVTSGKVGEVVGVQCQRGQWRKHWIYTVALGVSTYAVHDYFEEELCIFSEEQKLKRAPTAAELACCDAAWVLRAASLVEDPDTDAAELLNGLTKAVAPRLAHRLKEVAHIPKWLVLKDLRGLAADLLSPVVKKVEDECSVESYSIDRKD